MSLKVRVEAELPIDQVALVFQLAGAIKIVRFAMSHGQSTYVPRRIAGQLTVQLFPQFLAHSHKDWSGALLQLLVRLRGNDMLGERRRVWR